MCELQKQVCRSLPINLLLGGQEKLCTQNDVFRIHAIQNTYDDGVNSDEKIGGPYRTEFRRDYARVLHCPSFRRLENKTQLFPGQESDFFRNRLTHSLEVAQIARSIACKFKSRNPECDFIEPDVCEVAGLIHDIGHPPFGHNGERALDDCMKDCGGFEGNAQTLHIILRSEKKERPDQIFDDQGCDQRCGLNLTVRTIASGLKYDNLIPVFRDGSTGFQKGYYQCDRDIIEIVKEKLVGDKNYTPFKTVECSIMDIADDIAYSTYDLEDAFKAGFLTPYKMMAANESIYEQISLKLKKDNIIADSNTCRTSVIKLFSDVWKDSIDAQKKIKPNDKEYATKTRLNSLNSYAYSEEFASDGFLRNKFSSYLISRFINGVSIQVNREHPVLSKVVVDSETKLLINVLKHFSYVCLINSSRLKVVENRGYEIIKKMFERLTEQDGYRLLPEDFQGLYFSAKTDEGKRRVICDFIAGMTDRYAVEFYGRLFSENPQTIFKPI